MEIAGYTYSFDRQLRGGDMDPAGAIRYDSACDFVEPDGAAPPDQVARVHRAVERAARLGAARVLLVPGRTREGVDPAAVRRHFAAVAAGCRDAARARGMQAMIAN